MKFAWSSILCLLVIQAAAGFKEIFKHLSHDEDKPSILDIFTKPKIPGINIQLGSHFGAGGSHGSGSGSFGFGFGFGGHFQPAGPGVNLPPKDTVNVKPVYPGEDKKKVGPRPNSEEDKGDYYPKPGSYDDDKDYSKPGSNEDVKDPYPKPGDYPKYEEKESLPDWEDIGEKYPKSESLMDGDMVGDGLIQPRQNRRRSKRFIESKVYHVPILFQSNAKPYKVKIHSNPNSLMKGN